MMRLYVVITKRAQAWRMTLKLIGHIWWGWWGTEAEEITEENDQNNLNDKGKVTWSAQIASFNWCARTDSANPTMSFTKISRWCLLYFQD